MRCNDAATAATAHHVLPGNRLATRLSIPAAAYLCNRLAERFGSRNGGRGGQAPRAVEEVDPVAFYRQIWLFLEGYRATMAVALACALGHTLLGLVPALIVREIVRRIETGAGAAAGADLLASWS